MKIARLSTMTAAVALATSMPAAPAHAEPFIGQLMLTGYNFAPRGCALANGQLLSISQNSALFALLGTTYGGNGTTTFALPDLRGRIPIHNGTGPGLSSYVPGQAGGQETVTLLSTQMPQHTHTATLNVAAVDANTRSPVNASFSLPTSTKLMYEGTTAPSGDTMQPGSMTVQNAGGSLPHSNIKPYLAMSWCIYTIGVFPSRS